MKKCVYYLQMEVGLTKTETWVRLAAIGVTVVTAGIIAAVTARYLLGILAPFLCAALISSLLRPAAVRLRSRTRIPEKVGGTLLLVFAVGILCAAVLLVGEAAYSGARGMVASLSATLSAGQGPMRALTQLTDRLAQLFPGESARLGSAADLTAQFMRQAVASAGGALTDGAASALVGLPRMLLSVAVGVIALFYLFFDGDALFSQVRGWIGEERCDRIAAVGRRIRDGVGGYLRAYLSLWVLTLAQLFSGLLLLDVERPLPTALVISFVDLLPVLGVGAVLIPWSLLAVLSGETARGVGLAVLFVVITVVRQAVDPRLVGDSRGLHPLIALAAAYAGYRLAGFWGMVLAPVMLCAAAAVRGQAE